MTSVIISVKALIGLSWCPKGFVMLYHIIFYIWLQDFYFIGKTSNWKKGDNYKRFKVFWKDDLWNVKWYISLMTLNKLIPIYCHWFHKIKSNNPPINWIPLDTYILSIVIQFSSLSVKLYNFLKKRFLVNLLNKCSIFYLVTFSPPGTVIFRSK